MNIYHGKNIGWLLERWFLSIKADLKFVEDFWVFVYPREHGLKPDGDGLDFGKKLVCSFLDRSKGVMRQY
jgi:hypothetical protein